MKSTLNFYIWGYDLADMQLISKLNKEFRFSLCVIDIFSKYSWVIILKDKKGFTITNAVESFLKESNRKPNKICVDKGSKFYNRSMKLWLEKNDIEMHSTHNEGKSVVAERFIRTLKNKIYKYMNLNDIVNECNNTYHTTINMKPVDVKSRAYINPSKEINYGDPKFKIGDIVRISKCKSIFAEGYVPSWSKEKVKNTVLWTYVISDLKGKEIVGTICEEEMQKTNQKQFRDEKVIQRKGDKLYVKWKGYDSPFNSWINKKDIV